MSALHEALGELPDAVFADLLEGDDAYRLVLDMPGVTAEGLSVAVTGSQITLEAERAKDVPPDATYVSEERALFLDTEVPLPPAVAPEEATATIADGVLTMHLPKLSRDETVGIPVEDA
jgi:HSP20 family molecular chaperone IbpA